MNATGRSAARLGELPVLVVDCQATAAAPRGHLLELGWTRLGAETAAVRSCLIKLPDSERIPPAVVRITGISERMLHDGIDQHAAWRALLDAADTQSPPPAPTIVHFARFERPFLDTLAAGRSPLDIVCTHEIARRLLPDLPRCSLRALAGYFGRAVGALRRSADHVEATAFVWRELLPLLAAEGVLTWGELHEWLTVSVRRKAARRVWPLPRDVRLSLPDSPGVYRMLRSSGDVLYVGKAVSLRNRVNSYFRKQTHVPERMLEMLTQARAISFQVTASALEAALLEPDEIKRLHPPYNIALSVNDRSLWFTAPDLSECAPGPTPRCPLGPFPSVEVLRDFATLAREDYASLFRGRSGPNVTCVEEGCARLRAAHRELSRDDLDVHSRLLRLGTRLWREGRRDRDEPDDMATGLELFDGLWTPEQVQIVVERLALRAAHARRRAKWLTRLVDASVAWSEPGASDTRLLVIECGDVVSCTTTDTGIEPPIPPGYRRPIAARRAAFDVSRFDRLRVLTTELKRLSAAGAPVAVRFRAAPALTGRRLARVLAWV